MNTYGNGSQNPIPDLYSQNEPAPATTEVFDVLHPANNQRLSKLIRVYGYGHPGAVVWAAFNKSEPLISTVKADGSWEFPLSFGFSEGAHQINLTHYHAGTNIHKRINFTVSSSQQSVFTLLSPNNGDVLDDYYPIIYGNAAPGDKIEGSSAQGGTANCTATSEGNFAFRFTSPLSSGPQTVTVQNSAGERIERNFIITEPMLVPSEKFSTPIVRTPQKPTGEEKTFETTFANTPKESELEVSIDPPAKAEPATANYATPEGTKYADPAEFFKQTSNFAGTDLNAVVAQHQNPTPPSADADEVFNTVKGLSYDEIKSLSAQSGSETVFTPFEVPQNAGEAVFISPPENVQPNEE